MLRHFISTLPRKRGFFNTTLSRIQVKNADHSPNISPPKHHLVIHSGKLTGLQQKCILYHLWLIDLLEMVIFLILSITNQHILAPPSLPRPGPRDVSPPPPGWHHPPRVPRLHAPEGWDYIIYTIQYVEN